MTPRLDRSKPFGEVIPTGGYWQDGHYFDVHENYVRSEGDVIADPDPAPVETKAEKPKVSAQEIDLAAWAKGEAKYPHYSVVKAANAAFPEDVGSSRASIIAVLIANGVVSEGEAVL